MTPPPSLDSDSHSDSGTGADAGTARVYFIRHGETRWSLTGQHTGRTDLPLTAHGETQASDVRAVLGTIHFLHVFTSPMRRARRTCELSELEPTAVVEPDLSEWDYGDYEGRTTPDIRRDQPGWNVFRDGCPNGETPDDVARRADRLIERLRRLVGNVAVYSHGQFGSAFAARWVGLPIIVGAHLPLDAGSVSILGYNPAHPETPVIALWNDTPTVTAERART